MHNDIPPSERKRLRGWSLCRSRVVCLDHLDLLKWFKRENDSLESTTLPSSSSLLFSSHHLPLFSSSASPWPVTICSSYCFHPLQLRQPLFFSSSSPVRPFLQHRPIFSYHSSFQPFFIWSCFSFRS